MALGRDWKPAGMHIARQTRAHLDGKWPGTVVAVILFGAALRVAMFLWINDRPLDIDASEYLSRAPGFSFAHFWEASYREPLMVGLIKLWTAPFGYSHDALRSLSLTASIVSLPAIWSIGRRTVGPLVAFVALATTSLNALLLFTAPRGLRADIVLLLAATAGLLLLGSRSRARPWWHIAIPVGLLAGLRLEVALLFLLVLGGATLAKRIRPTTVVGALIIAGVLAGPWMWSNHLEYGDAFHHSNVAATVWYDHFQQYEPGTSYADYELEPSGDFISWRHFYLEFLGPRETVERAATGAAWLALAIPRTQMVPPMGATEVLPGPVYEAIGIVGWLYAGLIVAIMAYGVWIERRSAAVWIPLAVVILGMAPFAALTDYFFLDNMRYFAYLWPFLGVLTGLGIRALLDSYAESETEATMDEERTTDEERPREPHTW